MPENVPSEMAQQGKVLAFEHMLHPTIPMMEGKN